MSLSSQCRLGAEISPCQSPEGPVHVRLADGSLLCDGCWSSGNYRVSLVLVGQTNPGGHVGCTSRWHAQPRSIPCAPITTAADGPCEVRGARRAVPCRTQVCWCLHRPTPAGWPPATSHCSPSNGTGLSCAENCTARQRCPAPRLSPARRAGLHWPRLLKAKPSPRRARRLGRRRTLY